MKKAVTLADIAKSTGFSINTISHALNDKKDISEKTKELIRKSAVEMGYIGNASASFLRSGISKSIAIILGDISNPHFSIMVKEIESYIKNMGYTAFILNTDEDEKIENQAIISAISKNVDGIIICPVQKSKKNIKFLIETGVPFTIIGRYFKDLNANYVVCDDVNSGYLAAEHLIKKGHRNILFFNGPKYISSADERLIGVKKAFEAYGFYFNENNVFNIPVKMGESEKQINEILIRSNDITAAICFSDLIAWEVAYILKNIGLSVPKDFALVGFDNIQSKFLSPLILTTISTSKSKMSIKAVDILFKSNNKQERIVLETKLVIGEST